MEEPSKHLPDAEFLSLVANAQEARERAYNHLLAWWRAATPEDKRVFIAELMRMAGDPVSRVIGFAAVVGYQDVVLDAARRAVTKDSQ